MGIIADASPIPESYAGPRTVWWDPSGVDATFVEADMTADEALVKGGLDWTVSKRPLQYASTDDRPEVAYSEVAVPGWVAVARDTDDAFMGMVTPSYHEYQNRSLSEAVQDVLDQSGKANVHTIGSLYGGRIVFIAAKFDKDLHVRGDEHPIEDYLVASTGHDGRHALRFDSTPVRPICGNTLLAAQEASSGHINIRHTSGMGNRTKEIRAALDIHFKHIERLELTLNDLVKRPMSIDAVKAYTVALLPANPDVERAFRTEAERDAIVALYDQSPNLQSVPESAYRAFQATVEYLDQGKAFRDTKRMPGADRRALAILEGGSYALKSRSLALLVKA